MAVIANLDINLGARTTGLEQGLTRAQGRVNGFSNAVKAASTRMQAFVVQAGLMIAATVGVTKALGGIRQAFRDIDASAKLAARIGADVNEIFGLQLAAEKTGFSTERMNKALEVLDKRLGEAAQGSGEAKQALEILNLRAEDLLQMGIAERMGTIADALQAVGTQGEKAAIVSDLFSRANLGLVNTLDLTAAGLEREAAIAEKLGFSISEIDAKRIQQTNDAFTQLKFALKGAAIQTSILVAGPLKDLADALTNIVVIGTQVRQKLDDMIPPRLMDFIDRLGLLKSPLANFNRALEEMGVVEPIDSAIFRPDQVIPELTAPGAGAFGPPPTPAALQHGTAAAFSAANRMGAGDLQSTIVKQADKMAEKMDALGDLLERAMFEALGGDTRLLVNL